MMLRTASARCSRPCRSSTSLGQRRSRPGPAATTCRPIRWPATARPATPAAKPYDGGEPTGAPDRNGQEDHRRRRAEADRHRLLQRDLEGHRRRRRRARQRRRPRPTARPRPISTSRSRFIDNYITKGVDGILFAANDPVAIAPVLKKALVEGHQRRRLRRQLRRPMRASGSSTRPSSTASPSR